MPFEPPPKLVGVGGGLLVDILFELDVPVLFCVAERVEVWVGHCINGGQLGVAVGVMVGVDVAGGVYVGVNVLKCGVVAFDPSWSTPPCNIVAIITPAATMIDMPQNSGF